MGEYLGHAVVDGAVRFLSVSAIEKADASSATGCLRAWWFRYVGGIKEPDTEAQAHGRALHAQAAAYLRTGDRSGLDGQVLRGLHLMPPPGPDLLVEHDLTHGGLAAAILRVGPSIPMVGQIDCSHRRGLNWGGSEITETRDPPGTIEVIDWKFPGKADRAKLSMDMPKLIQMAGYGTWAFLVAPDAPLVRLSHGTMPASGSPAKASKLCDREMIAPAWERANAVARSIADAARETDERKVEANTRVCGPLMGVRRACRYRPQCSAGMHSSLSDIVGPTVAAGLIPAEALSRPRQPLEGAPYSMSMTILDQIFSGSPAAVGAPVPVPQAPQPAPVVGLVHPSPSAPLPPPPPDFGSFGNLPAFGSMPPGVTVASGVAVAQVDLAEMARVRAEVEAAEAQRARAALIPAGFREAWAAALAFGQGQPAVTGAAALAYTAMTRPSEAPSDAPLAGTGNVGARVMLTDPNQIHTLVTELRAWANQAPTPTHVAPAPTPAASPPVAPTPPPMPHGGLVPPDAPPHRAPDQAPIAAAPTDGALAGVLAHSEGTGKKRGAKKSATAGEVSSQAAQAGAPTQTASAPSQATSPAAGPSGLVVIVNGGASAALAPLDPVLRYVCDQLQRAFGVQLQVGPHVIRDFRLNQEGPLGFGRWRAAVTAMVRDMSDKGMIPDGAYGYDFQPGDELGEAFVAGLREACDARGGDYVRSAR